MNIYLSDVIGGIANVMKNEKIVSVNLTRREEETPLLESESALVG